MEHAVGFVLRKVRKMGREHQVLDEYGRVCYHVKQQLFSFGKKIRVFDVEGREVALVRGDFSLIVPKYRVCIDGEEPFMVKRKFSLAADYVISGRPWAVYGSVNQYRCFDADRDDYIVFELQSATNSWTDRFYIDVFDVEHSLSAICVAIAIHAAVDDIRKKNHK